MHPLLPSARIGGCVRCSDPPRRAWACVRRAQRAPSVARASLGVHALPSRQGVGRARPRQTACGASVREGVRCRWGTGRETAARLAADERGRYASGVMSGQPRSRATFLSGMPGKSQSGGVDLGGLLYLTIVLVVMFVPILLGRRRSPPGGPDSDAGEGWGRGPSRPRVPPDLPGGGGVPLRDAEPARVRLRGHDRLMDRRPARDRRSAPEPDRKPVRT